MSQSPRSQGRKLLLESIRLQCYGANPVGGGSVIAVVIVVIITATATGRERERMRGRALRMRAGPSGTVPTAAADR